MTTTQHAAARARAIKLAIVPRAPRLPVDAEMLATRAALEFCPCAPVSRRSRADYIARLISDAIMMAAADQI